MRLLFLGAGATGGYFGGRLAASGVDVTFLVRPRRREQLARDGLRIESPLGDLKTPVRAVAREEPGGPYDAIVLTSKAYDLAEAIEAIRPVVGDATVVVPLLNGLKHLDDLDAAFGAPRVLGGTCHISVTLGEDGVIRHLGSFASVTQGARFPEQGVASGRLHELFGAAFEARHPDDILGAIWEKWMLIAALAGATCLMRASTGEIIMAEGGQRFIGDMLEECIAIAAANGHRPGREAMAATRTVLTNPQANLSASMLRDMERGGPIEADNIIGDLVGRGRARGIAAPLLETARIHLETYQHRLARRERHTG